jgi:hypothetical protein
MTKFSRITAPAGEIKCTMSAMNSLLSPPSFGVANMTRRWMNREPSWRCSATRVTRPPMLCATTGNGWITRPCVASLSIRTNAAPFSSMGWKLG